MNRPVTDHRIPTGWSKGEPLMVVGPHTINGKTVTSLMRSGSYLNEAPHKIEGELSIHFAEWREMVKFQEWWDAPPPEGGTVELTRSEYLEYVQEVLSFAPRRFSGTLETIVPQAARPGAQLCYKGCTEAEAEALQRAHMTYCSMVESILYPGEKRDENE